MLFFNFSLLEARELSSSHNSKVSLRASIILFGLLACVILSQPANAFFFENKYVKLVKDTPIKDKTLGEYIESYKYFRNTSWDIKETTQNRVIVTLHAEIDGKLIVADYKNELFSWVDDIFKEYSADDYTQYRNVQAFLKKTQKLKISFISNQSRDKFFDNGVWYISGKEQRISLHEVLGAIFSNKPLSSFTYDIANVVKSNLYEKEFNKYFSSMKGKVYYRSYRTEYMSERFSRSFNHKIKEDPTFRLSIEDISKESVTVKIQYYSEVNGGDGKVIDLIPAEIVLTKSAPVVTGHGESFCMQYDRAGSESIEIRQDKVYVHFNAPYSGSYELKFDHERANLGWKWGLESLWR